MLGLIGLVVFVGVGIFVFVTRVSYSVIKTSGEIALTPCQESPQSGVSDWAIANQFGYVGAFTTELCSLSPSIFAWKHSEKPLFLCQYDIIPEEEASYNVGNVTMVKINFDLVTVFEDGVSLTTASLSDAQSLPKQPNAYEQSFSGMDFDDRLRNHIDAEVFLLDAGGATFVQRECVFEEEMVKSVREEFAYVHKMKFWPLRGGYWIYIRRWLWHNKSIEEQHAKGMIKLPNELSGGAVELGEDILRP